jgi:hypothetical protein
MMSLATGTETALRCEMHEPVTSLEFFWENIVVWLILAREYNMVCIWKNKNLSG